MKPLDQITLKQVVEDPIHTVMFMDSQQLESVIVALVSVYIQKKANRGDQYCK